MKPIKSALSRSELVDSIVEGLNADNVEISKRQVKGVIDHLEQVMKASVAPGSVGEFVLSGIMKVFIKKVPARKAGTKIRNPATGEMMEAKARPASVRVKMRPLSKLRKAALGESD